MHYKPNNNCQNLYTIYNSQRLLEAVHLGWVKHHSTLSNTKEAKHAVFLMLTHQLGMLLLRSHFAMSNQLLFVQPGRLPMFRR